MHVTPPPRSKRHALGFSLIELMIAVAIIGLLGAVAFPTYMDSVRKSRRSDAFTALGAIQLNQERCRANQPTYCASITAATTDDPPGLNLPAVTASGYYNLTLANVDATGFTAVATPVDGKSQVNDGDCARLCVRIQRGNIAYASGAGACGAFSPANRCWAR